jgi:outer membrane protein TolC
MSTELRCAALLTSLVLPLACAQLEQRRSDEERRLASEVGERMALAFPPKWAQLGASAPSPEARSLLAAGLDDNEAVRVALLENRRIRAEFERLGVSAYERVRAGLLANPVFSALVLLQDPSPDVELGISQPLVDLFRRSLRMDLADAELEVARAAVLEALIRVTCDVRAATLACRVQVERVRLVRDAAVAAREAEALTRALHSAGNVTDLELSTRRRMRTAAELELLEVQALTVERREDLLTLLGLSTDPGFELTEPLELDQFPTAPPEDLEARALGNSLALAQLDARLRAARARADLPRSSNVLGTSSLGVGAGKDDGEDSWGVGPILSVPIPIFDTGASAQSSARAEWLAWFAERDRVVRELASTIRRLAARQASLSARAALARAELLPLARQIVIETLQQYNSMQIGAFNVLHEREIQLDQERTALDLWEDAWRARIDLDLLSMGALPDTHRPSRSAGHWTLQDETRGRRQ